MVKVTDILHLESFAVSGFELNEVNEEFITKQIIFIMVCF